MTESAFESILVDDQWKLIISKGSDKRYVHNFSGVSAIIISTDSQTMPQPSRIGDVNLGGIVKRIMCDGTRYVWAKSSSENQAALTIATYPLGSTAGGGGSSGSDTAASAATITDLISSVVALSRRLTDNEVKTNQTKIDLDSLAYDLKTTRLNLEKGILSMYDQMLKLNRRLLDEERYSTSVYEKASNTENRLAEVIAQMNSGTASLPDKIDLGEIKDV